MFREQNDFWGFGGNWKLCHLGGGAILKICKKSAATWKISKMWLILKKKMDSATSTGKEREMKNLQGRIKKLKKEIEKVDRRIDLWSVKVSAGNGYSNRPIGWGVAEDRMFWRNSWVRKGRVNILRYWAMCFRWEASWVAPIPKRWSGVRKKKRNGPKKKRR